MELTQLATETEQPRPRKRGRRPADIDHAVVEFLDPNNTLSRREMATKYGVNYTTFTRRLVKNAPPPAEIYLDGRDAAVVQMDPNEVNLVNAATLDGELAVGKEFNTVKEAKFAVATYVYLTSKKVAVVKDDPKRAVVYRCGMDDNCPFRLRIGVSRQSIKCMKLILHECEQTVPQEVRVKKYLDAQRRFHLNALIGKPSSEPPQILDLFDTSSPTTTTTTSRKRKRKKDDMEHEYQDLIEKESPARTRVVHIVLFEFLPEASHDQVKAICQQMWLLKSHCLHPETKKPYIRSVVGGKDMSIEGRQNGLTHAFVVEFESVEDRDHYVKVDKAHEAFVKAAGKVVKNVAVLDFHPGLFD